MVRALFKPWTREDVLRFITACLEDGGIPQFRVYSQGAFVFVEGKRTNAIKAVCFMARNEVRGSESVTFYDVPDDILYTLANIRHDWEYLARVYTPACRYRKLGEDWTYVSSPCSEVDVCGKEGYECEDLTYYTLKKKYRPYLGEVPLPTKPEEHKEEFVEGVKRQVSTLIEKLAGEDIPEDVKASALEDLLSKIQKTLKAMKKGEKS